MTALCVVAVVGSIVAAVAHDTAAPTLMQHPVIKTIQPIAIALPPFVVGNGVEANAVNLIRQVVADDLRSSGKFIPIYESRFPASMTVNAMPDFNQWRGAEAQELVVGSITRQPDDRVKVEFRLFNVISAVQLTGMRYVGEDVDLDRIGHLISEAVYERAIGTKRDFGSASRP